MELSVFIISGGFPVNDRIDIMENRKIGRTKAASIVRLPFDLRKELKTDVPSLFLEIILLLFTFLHVRWSRKTVGECL